MFSTWLGAERRAASCSRLRRGRAGKPRENQRLKLPCGGVEVDVPRSPAITRLIFSIQRLLLRCQRRLFLS